MVTELLEDGLVRKGEIRNGGRVIYLETAQSSSEKDASANRLTVAHHKAEITRLYDVGDFWGALRIAREHNIHCRIELPEVTI